MTINAWLECVAQDADRRGLPALKPLLDILARSAASLRAADWNRRADEPAVPHSLDVR